MNAAWRAAASVLMLAGFYLVALIQFVAVLAFVVWIAMVTTAGIGLKLGLPLLLAVGATGVGLWRAIRTRPEPRNGVIIGPEAAPELWQQVGAIAAEVRTRMPDEIRVVPEVNAAVSEDTKLLGLIGGFRRLYIGLPLVQTLSVQQLRSVLAHELGHYSGRHTRLGGIAYRGRLAIGGTIRRIGRYNPVGWVFKAYARLYLLVDNAASRRQELEADLASVRVSGPAVAASALRELPVLDSAWDFYFAQYVSSGWGAGYAPDDLFGGFADLVAARKQELDKLRTAEPENKPSRWDTHPPIAERIRAMASAPQLSHPVDERRPATALLPHVDLLGQQLQSTVVELGDRQVLPWPQFTAAAITAGQQRTADRVFRALARFLNRDQAGLPELLDLVAAGRLPEFAEPFVPDATREEAPGRFVPYLDAIITLAAIRSGAATWRHSWSEPAALVGRDGEPVDFEKVAGLAAAPATLPEARQRLAALGISVERATVVQTRATAQGARVIAGMANIKIDGVDHDILVLDRGFVFVPAPKKGVDDGKRRLGKLVRSAPVAELAQRHRFLPYEEVTGLTVTKKTPVRARLLVHGGAAISLEERWGSEDLGGGSRNAFTEVLERLAEK